MIVKAVFQDTEVTSLEVESLQNQEVGSEIRVILSPSEFCYLSKLLKTHSRYRRHFYAFNNANIFTVHLRGNPAIPFDYNSCKLAQEKVIQQAELEDALHWLSTLGGAYSNLGDHSAEFVSFR